MTTAPPRPAPALPEPGDFGLVPTYGNWRDRLIGWAIRFGTATPTGKTPGRLLRWLLQIPFIGGLIAMLWSPLWETSPVNHAFLYVGNGMIVEAAPGGARKVPLSNYDSSTITWSTGVINPDPEQRVWIVEAAEGYAEKKVGYGWLDIIAIALAQSRTGHLVDPGAPFEDQPWWVQRVESLDTLICSQLVDLSEEAGGVHLFSDGRLPGLVSPGDLWRLVTRPVAAAA